MNKNYIENLIYLFSRLPGLGPRSARRIVLHLLKEKDTRIDNFITSLNEVRANTYNCELCNNIDICTPCKICTNAAREDAIIAVVEDVADLWAIERSGSFRGKYHILGGTLSAARGKSPELLGLEILHHRIKTYDVKEIILATSSTLDGQTTAFFISDYFKNAGVKFSRLASGIPIGGEIDYLDEGTLSAALSLRQPF
jgi:recombination protein RecR